MALEIRVVNRAQNKLAQKVFIYIDGQQKNDEYPSIGKW